MRRPSCLAAPLALALAFVLLNIDAALACSTKEDARRRALLTELRFLVQEQRAFLAEEGRYANTVGELGWRGGRVNLIRLRTERAGFTATAADSSLRGVTCYVAEGTVSARLPEADGRAPGFPWCVGTPPGVMSFRFGEAMSYTVFASMLALTAATGLFLPRRGRRNWPLLGLAMTTAYALRVAASPVCGTSYYVEPLIITSVVGAGLFALALRRRFAVPVG